MIFLFTVCIYGEKTLVCGVCPSSRTFRAALELRVVFYTRFNECSKRKDFRSFFYFVSLGLLSK